MLGFLFYPFALNVYTSFFSKHLIRPGSKFVGFDNYLHLFDRTYFWLVTENEIIWTVFSVFFEVVLGLAVAVLLNQKLRGINIARAFVILPWVTPVVITVLMWTWILNELYGIINRILMGLGLIDSAISFWSSPAMAMGTLVAINVWWGFPFMTIIFLAGLKSIDPHLYECREGRWRIAVAGVHLCHPSRTEALHSGRSAGSHHLDLHLFRPDLDGHQRRAQLPRHAAAAPDLPASFPELSPRSCRGHFGHLDSLPGNDLKEDDRGGRGARLAVYSRRATAPDQGGPRRRGAQRQRGVRDDRGHASAPPTRWSFKSRKSRSTTPRARMRLPKAHTSHVAMWCAVIRPRRARMRPRVCKS